MLIFVPRTRRLFGSLKPGACSPLRPYPHFLFHTSPLHRREGKPKPEGDPVAEFFARFPDFNYNPNRTWPEEWKRLRTVLEEQLQRAAIKRFQSTYSFDPSDLAAWHKMCNVLGIVPPRTLEGCRAVIKQLYINMVDLEHEGHRGNVNAVQRFPTEVALSEYTLRTEKVYKKRLVPRKSLLKLLLRHILHPRPEEAEKGRMRNREKKGGKQEDGKQKGVGEPVKGEK